MKASAFCGRVFAAFLALGSLAVALSSALARDMSPFQLSATSRQGGLVQGLVPAGTVHLEWNGKPLPFAADGHFIVGLDRDEPAEGTLLAIGSTGIIARQQVPIARRSWRIERINLPRPKGPSPAYLRLREGELKRIEVARSANAASDGWRQRFIAPARGRLTGRFGSQRIYRGEPASYHGGLDIAAGAGAIVVAPANGVVVLAGTPTFSLEGNLVIIDHGMGLNSAFLHLATASVSQGQTVRQGQPIGTVGSSGRATGPHLHWSVKWKDAKLDPELLFAP